MQEKIEFLGRGYNTLHEAAPHVATAAQTRRYVNEVLRTIGTLFSKVDRRSEFHLAQAFKTATAHPGVHQDVALDLLLKYVPDDGGVKEGIREVGTQQRLNEALVFLLAGGKKRGVAAREGLARKLDEANADRRRPLGSLLFEAATRTPFRRLSKPLQELLVEEAHARATELHDEHIAGKVIAMAQLQADHIKDPKLKARLADCVRNIHTNARERNERLLLAVATAALEKYPQEPAAPRKTSRRAPSNGRRKAK